MTMKAKYFYPAVATVLLILSGTVAAQDDRMNWSSLTEEQRQVLGPLAENWDTLPIERRARLVDGASRWSRLDTEDRSAARERFQTWQNLSDGERTAIRDRYNQFQRLTPGEACRSAAAATRAVPQYDAGPAAKSQGSPAPASAPAGQAEDRRSSTALVSFQRN
jgi:predicted Fe-S protein YdhL (DUF1289 family)